VHVTKAIFNIKPECQITNTIAFLFQFPFCPPVLFDRVAVVTSITQVRRNCKGSLLATGREAYRPPGVRPINGAVERKGAGRG
jgi:hypothetical protein